MDRKRQHDTMENPSCVTPGQHIIQIKKFKTNGFRITKNSIHSVQIYGLLITFIVFIAERNNLRLAIRIWLFTKIQILSFVFFLFLEIPIELIVTTTNSWNLFLYSFRYFNNEHNSYWLPKASIPK